VTAAWCVSTFYVDSAAGTGGFRPPAPYGGMPSARGAELSLPAHWGHGPAAGNPGAAGTLPADATGRIVRRPTALKPFAPPADKKDMQRARAEIRMLCADMVDVCWKERTGRKYKATALLEDISRSGMCLQFEIPVPVGTRVDIHCPGDKLTGTVRYCVYQEIGYFVGVELEKTSHWSRQQFEPQHLLDLEELVYRSAKRSGAPGGPSRYVH
jgi:PilZ domain